MNERTSKEIVTVIAIREVKSEEKELISDIVSIHLNTFTGFFLTFMGSGFLNQMYRSYCDQMSLVFWWLKTMEKLSDSLHIQETSVVSTNL